MDGFEDYDRICDSLNELDLDHVSFRSIDHINLHLGSGDVPIGKSEESFLQSVIKLSSFFYFPLSSWKVAYFNEPGPKCAKHYDSNNVSDYSAYLTRSNVLKIYRTGSLEPFCWNSNGEVFRGLF